MARRMVQCLYVYINAYAADVYICACRDSINFGKPAVFPHGKSKTAMAPV